MATNVSVTASLDGKVSSSFKNTFNLAHKELGSLSLKTKKLDLFSGLDKSGEKLRLELASLQRQHDKIGSASAELAKKIRKTKSELNSAEKQAEKYGQSLRSLIKNQIKYNLLAELSDKKDRLVNQSQQIKQNLGNKRDQLVGTGMALLAIPLKHAKMFESQMVQVAKKIEATGQAFEALNAKAKALRGKTLHKATEVAQGMEKLAREGFKNEQILNAIEPALLLAANATAKLGTTADIASNIMTNFNIPAIQMGQVADTLAKVTTSYNVSLEELGETMTYVGDTAELAGMSMEQASVMAGLLGKAGIEGTIAGTELQGMLSQLAAPAAGATTMLKKLGVQTTDSMGNLLDLTDVIGSVAEATDYLGNADQIAMFKELVGMRPANALGQMIEQKGKGAIQDYMQEVQAAGGTAQTNSTVYSNQNIEIRVDGGDPENILKAIEKYQHEQRLGQQHNLQGAG